MESEAVDRVVDALSGAAFLTVAVLTRIGAAHDLSLTQLRLLGILRDRRPRMADVAERLGLDRSTMTGLVARAERRGLVERTRSNTDGRSVEVELTPTGRALADRLTVEARSALAPYVAGFAAGELAALTGMLERIDAPPGRVNGPAA